MEFCYPTWKKNKERNLHKAWELWHRPSTADAEHFDNLSLKWDLLPLSDMLIVIVVKLKSWYWQVARDGAHTAQCSMVCWHEPIWILAKFVYMNIYLVYFLSASFCCSWRYFCSIKCFLLLQAQPLICVWCCLYLYSCTLWNIHPIPL